MNSPRVYVDPPLQEGQKLALDPAASHHLMRVLRLNVGQIITVCDGQGNDYRATLLPPRGTGRQQQVWVELGSCQPNKAEHTHSLHIGVAPISGERFERMLEQLAELGVVSVTPLLTERTNVRQISEPKLQRWRRVGALCVSPPPRAWCSFCRVTTKAACSTSWRRRPLRLLNIAT